MPIDFEVTMNEYLPLRDVVFNTLCLLYTSDRKKGDENYV